MATNAAVQALYGAGMRDPTQFWSNLSGFIFGVFYTAHFAAHSKRGTLRHHYVVGGAVSAAVAALAFFRPFDTAARPLLSFQLCGCTAVLGSILLAWSPAATIAEVLRSGDTSSMPVAQSVVAWLNAIMWTCYGVFVARDFVAWLPNTLGFALTTVQLITFARFGVGSMATKEP